MLCPVSPITGPSTGRIKRARDGAGVVKGHDKVHSMLRLVGIFFVDALMAEIGDEGTGEVSVHYMALLNN